MVETPNESEEHQDEESFLRARREKLEQIKELGHDPWGHRFDDRQYIGDIRARLAEVKYVLEDGTVLDLPDIDAEGFDFKAWKQEQGKGELIGPTVRAAGRLSIITVAAFWLSQLAIR